MYNIAEQGFNQVLHMSNKYCNRLDINKTGEIAIQLKLTNLQPALKKLDENPRERFAAVGTNYFWK